ncbi:MAG TPA: glycogen-binding domain-containing protein [Planctomycetota bacterium]|nr:glycogen-binding domain-containing protein [Planctomycetota bacterium]
MAKPETTKAPRQAVTRRVPFTAQVEGAKEVILTGEFTNWAKDKIRLESTGKGKWNALLELPAGEYRYRLLVDGQWRDHSEAAKRVPNPFGSQDCILVVS